MTLLGSSSSYSDTPHMRKIVRRIGSGFLRLINGWITAIIAQREYQTDLTVLRSLDDRQLRDMGLDRGQIGAALADAAKNGAMKQSEILRRRNRITMTEPRTNPSPLPSNVHPAQTTNRIRGDNNCEIPTASELQTHPSTHAPTQPEMENA